ncbi:Mss4-like protein [Biscogniauxia sp. FL1348]|nr:Mss4-like protein [Biscogniauxia sp. FL1348]
MDAEMVDKFPVRTSSCLCGAVRSRMIGQPSRLSLCHCTSCQKSFGSAFASYALFKTEQVEFMVEDPSTIRTYPDNTPESGHILDRSVCGLCGSNVKVAWNHDSTWVFIPVGTIDGDKTDLVPNTEVWCKRRPLWLGIISGAQLYETEVDKGVRYIPEMPHLVHTDDNAGVHLPPPQVPGVERKRSSVNGCGAM